MSRSTSEPCSERGIEPCQSLMNRSMRRSCGSLSLAYLTNSGPGYELIPLMAFFVPLVGGAACAPANEGSAKASAEAVNKANVARGMEGAPFPVGGSLFSQGLVLLGPGFMRM